jgi:tRNA(adenine34) deaminase
MRLALELAAGPGDGADGEDDVPIGAVVLAPDGAVAGRGRNQCLAALDPTAQAHGGSMTTPWW